MEIEAASIGWWYIKNMSIEQTSAPTDDRRFLFLQGPHGPFFSQLASQLAAAGATCWRVGFNAGDQRFWSDRKSYIAFRNCQNDWPVTLDGILNDKAITDIVLYGDCRPIHAVAKEKARAAGVALHVFEEGYLRPYWVTYERGGSNGHSTLMQKSMDEIRASLTEADHDLPEAPPNWGDMRQHIFYGALYHLHVLAFNRGYPHFQPHRSLTVAQEARLNVGRFLRLPAVWRRRRLATAKIRRGGFPYHLALLQLEHDSSFQEHSPFSTLCQFLETTFDGFARGAPRHHHLVVKAHPLEDGRAPLRCDVARLAEEYGLTGRVHFIPGGKLARLLNEARSVVTVNSTAAQQALWRGLPVKAFGAAVYSRPELVSDQPLVEFFNRPMPPDTRAYRDFRRYLLETSQVSGGFYSAAGRRRLLRTITDRILAPDCPYSNSRPYQDEHHPRVRVVK